MKRMILATVLVAAAFAAHAGEDSSDRWFHQGLAWYQHPCGLSAFGKYGADDTLDDVRHAYYVTKHHPELCSKYFPDATSN
jgi:hypothetical protein